MSQKVKHVLKTYGKPALMLHCSVYCTTLVSCYAGLRFGFDIGTVVDSMQSYLPPFFHRMETVSSSPWIDAYLDAETGAR